MEKKIKNTGPVRPIPEVDIYTENNLGYLTYVTYVLHRAILGTFIFLFISISINLYFFFEGVNPKIISLTPDMRVIDIATLDKPIVSNAGLLSWYQQAITDTFTFSFSDWKKRLTDVREKYSESAFTGVANGLRDKIQKMEAERSTAIVKVVESPRLLDKMVVNGIMTWIVEAKIDIITEGLKERKTHRIISKAYIVRADPSETKNGIKIDKIILQSEQL